MKAVELVDSKVHAGGANGYFHGLMSGGVYPWPWEDHGIYALLGWEKGKNG